MNKKVKFFIYVIFTVASGWLLFSAASQYNLIQSQFMYLTRNLQLFYFSLVSASAIFIIFANEILRMRQIDLAAQVKKRSGRLNVARVLVLPTFVTSALSLTPISEVDQLFYLQLKGIQQDSIKDSKQSSIAEKIELCAFIKANYENLKPAMINDLDKVCSEKILEISKRSTSDLNTAFNWAYAEYVKKQSKYQIVALACLYAETNQKEFGVQLAIKHEFHELKSALSTLGNCSGLPQRSIASVE